ncbi:hypothetical protein FKR81_38310 [Lentzea tibetensis]|uniref:Uncharacterized protein n=1 Tax=Lentzea tibetensis TaxID=2591470 RepID=A0A563EH44_9PSEU|nr:hypothetical protein FKR81_38310 [Lentzea tibetensis]
MSSRALAALLALATALVAAFVVAPRYLAAIGSGGGFADQRHFVEALSKAFVEHWRSGGRDLSPDLARVVDYWIRYHLAKAVIAALLLSVLVTLGVHLWKEFLRAHGLGAGKRVALASTGVLVTMLALVSLATVMANVQGVVAPYSSLFPMLTGGAPDHELADTLEQVRRRLADSRDQTQPALDVMISDFARYHVAMAVIAAIVVIVLIGMTAVSWKRFSRTNSSDRRTRRVWRSFGVLSAMLSLAVIVVVAANATTAADPEPALLAAFEGGW